MSPFLTISGFFFLIPIPVLLNLMISTTWMKTTKSADILTVVQPPVWREYRDRQKLNVDLNSIVLCRIIHISKADWRFYQGRFTTERNDPRVNCYNRLMLQNWRVNTDISVIVDADACVHYMAKYAAKGEPKSKDVQSLFWSCTENQRIQVTEAAITRY